MGSRSYCAPGPLKLPASGAETTTPTTTNARPAANAGWDGLAF